MKKLFLFLLVVFVSFLNAQDIKFVNKEIKDSSVQYRYFASGSYPQLEGMKDKNIQKKINKHIYDVVKIGIEDFKNELKDWDLSNVPKDFNSDMDHNYTIFILDTNIFSFSFEVYCYYAGAAHPNHWTVSMNYNMKTGKQIILKDLFKPEEKYLQKISKYCINDLKNQGKLSGYEFDDYMLEEGAGAKDSNFVNFNFVQRGLQFTFDPYQVAAYALGTQYVIIPYRALFEMMKEDMLELIPNF